MLCFFLVREAKDLRPLFHFKLNAKAPALVRAGLYPHADEFPNRLLERLQRWHLRRGARLPALYRYQNRGWAAFWLRFSLVASAALRLARVAFRFRVFARLRVAPCLCPCLLGVLIPGALQIGATVWSLRHPYSIPFLSYRFYFCVRPRFFAKAHWPSPFEYALVALFAVNELVFRSAAFAAERALLQQLFRL